jgi:hypothetical protein
MRGGFSPFRHSRESGNLDISELDPRLRGDDEALIQCH